MGEVGRGQIRKGLGSGEDIRFLLSTLGKPLGVLFGQGVI